MPVTIESLKVVSYLDTSVLGNRVVKLMPLWDGNAWRVWVDVGDGVIEAKMMNVVEGDYVSKNAVADTDLFLPFVNLMWQQASWSEVAPMIVAITEDFHNMGTSLAKFRLFFEHRKTISVSRFALTELEYLATSCRTVFDLLQEIISYIWFNEVVLADPELEKRRKRSKLPDTFSKIVLVDKKEIRLAQDIEDRFGVPGPLATKYFQYASFFSILRNFRDSIIHGSRDSVFIFDTERGFCVDRHLKPFSGFDWIEEQSYNERLVSLLPWLTYLIGNTINACNDIVSALCTAIKFPKEIAPGYRVFVRGPHSKHLSNLLNAQTGGQYFWADKASPS